MYFDFVHGAIRYQIGPLKGVYQFVRVLVKCTSPMYVTTPITTPICASNESDAALNDWGFSGRWMPIEEAAALLTGGDVKLFHKEHKNTSWIVIERGPTNLSLHQQFQFVYICSDQGMIASRNLSIKKGKWARLSDHYSDADERQPSSQSWKRRRLAAKTAQVLH